MKNATNYQFLYQKTPVHFIVNCCVNLLISEIKRKRILRNFVV